MPTVTVDKEAIVPLYEAVREDANDTNWFSVRRDENSQLVVDRSGTEYDDFLTCFTDDECKFGYVRVTTGDEMSKRAKFAFITWAAPGAGALKKAKLSTDKGFLKQVIKNFAVEVLADEKSELKYESISKRVKQAGGANYGTGK